MEGVMFLDYTDRFGEASKDLTRWSDEGAIVSKHHTIEGLENFPSALINLFNGANIGKLLLKI